MKTGIYVYKDVLAGQYTYFGNYVNDAIALRAFKEACKDMGTIANDLELYCASKLDSVTGRIYHVEDDVPVTPGPVFIYRGNNNVSNDV